MQPLYNEFNLIEYYKDDNKYYKFKEDLIKDIPGLFSFCENNTDLQINLKDAGVLYPEENIWERESDNVIIFTNYEAAKSFLDRLNKYIKRMFALL